MRWIGMLVIGLVGCGGPPEEPLEGPDSLAGRRVVPYAAGCGDLEIFGTTLNDRAAVFLSTWQDLALASCVTGASVQRVVSLPDPDFDLRMQTGKRLSEWTCTDALAVPGPQVWAEAVPVSGTLTLTVEGDHAGTEAWPTAHATAVLDQVVFEDTATGQRFTVHHLEIPKAYVGWWPGGWYDPYAKACL